jgi:hypothetical protein
MLELQIGRRLPPGKPKFKRIIVKAEQNQHAEMREWYRAAIQFGLEAVPCLVGKVQTLEKHENLLIGEYLRRRHQDAIEHQQRQFEGGRTPHQVQRLSKAVQRQEQPAGGC